MAGAGEAIVAIAALAGAGAAVYSATNKPKLPDMPKPPEELKDKVADTAPLSNQRKQQRAAAGGRSGTILTGSLGLPGPGASGGTSTILGG